MKFWFGMVLLPFALVACPDPAPCAGSLIPPHWNSPGCPTFDDGAPAIPFECCPCPWPDMCPDGWPEVPDYCRTGCEPGQPIECCECPTPTWCDGTDEQNFNPPAWCDSKPWRDGGADSSNFKCAQGTCSASIPEGWRGPAGFSTGWDIDVAECPEGTTTIDGRGTPPPPRCAECACSTPPSNCGLATEWVVSSRECDAFDLGNKTDVSPPLGWDGLSCDTTNAVNAAMICGDDGPCIKSVRLTAPVVVQVETSCTPIKLEAPPTIPKLATKWIQSTIGRVCISNSNATDLPSCGDNQFCASVPDGFMTCIEREGDFACPASWPRKYTFYRDIEDNRSCSECSCGPVEVGNCVLKHRIFSDSECTIEASTLDHDTAGGTICHPVVDGIVIGGKKVEPIAERPSSCKPSGGQVIGELKLDDPFTVCCVDSID